MLQLIPRLLMQFLANRGGVGIIPLLSSLGLLTLVTQQNKLPGDLKIQKICSAAGLHPSSRWVSLQRVQDLRPLGSGEGVGVGCPYPRTCDPQHFSTTCNVHCSEEQCNI